MDLKIVIIVSVLNGVIVSTLLRNLTDFNEFQVLLSTVFSWTIIYFSHSYFLSLEKKKQKLLKIKIENQYKIDKEKNKERKENRIKLQKELESKKSNSNSQKNIIGIQLEKDS